ncbi:peroxiredoxin [Halomonas sp. WWR20]
MSVSIGQRVPDFTAQATSDTTVTLSDYRGRRVVLYFYPKDSTPGCTTEGGDFRDHKEAFDAIDTVVFGVSRDGLRAHENFKAKQGFNFELISDKDEALCRLFDVIKLKKLYGKEHLGIERSTFLIDSDGTLAAEWRKVKVAGHVEEVLAAARELHSHRQAQ